MHKINDGPVVLKKEVQCICSPFYTLCSMFLASLYKHYKSIMGGQCCSASETAVQGNNSTKSMSDPQPGNLKAASKGSVERSSLQRYCTMSM